MAEPLKNIYNDAFFDSFLADLPEIDPSVFRTKIYEDDWENKELKQRMRHIALVLGDLLPKSYAEATSIICQFVERASAKQRSEMNFEYMFLPDFIEIFGIDDFETSVKTMTQVTQFTSCEFAVRPFLIRYPDEMMQQMYDWAIHSHAMVRRLASEGTRPRLPWAMAVPSLKRDPTPILPILEKLKSDESETVRRSVANNLNDIAKDFPETVIELTEKWRGESKEVDWVIRHGSRTLLKRANPTVLKNFGLDSSIPVEILNFELNKSEIAIGDTLNFSFLVKNISAKESPNDSEKEYKLRLEYAIDYVKSNGKISRKVFQILEKTIGGVQVLSFQRKQSFKDMTTRKHQEGQHGIAILVNGQEKAYLSFYVSK
ncbi:MAG: DNA alkylation repair protein [Saprospiraceae bacterium]|nr:DNA alkylation repair protein [Saprospiraceae bacterium]